MTVWALFPASPRARRTPVTFRRVLGQTVCFARVRVRVARVVARADASRLACVEFAERTAAGRRLLVRTWLPFDQLASDRAKFATRWAALAHAEKSAAFLLAGVCASPRPAP